MTWLSTNLFPLLAQEELVSEAVVEPSALLRVWEFFSAGGVFMLLIAACSLVAITVIVYKALVMRSNRVVPVGVDGILGVAGQHLASGETDQLLANLNAYDSPLTRPALHALGGEFTNEETASAAAESLAREEVVRLHSGMPVLEVVITIAPLLGLLGTVSGLVSVFSVLGGAEAGDADPSELARGIAMALNTTVAGLAVAVPTVVAHSYFSRKIEKLAARMEVILGRGISSYYQELRRQKLAMPIVRNPNPTVEL